MVRVKGDLSKTELNPFIARKQGFFDVIVMRWPPVGSNKSPILKIMEEVSALGCILIITGGHEMQLTEEDLLRLGFRNIYHPENESIQTILEKQTGAKVFLLSK